MTATVEQACSRGDRVLQIRNFLVAGLGGIVLVVDPDASAPKAPVPKPNY